MNREFDSPKMIVLTAPSGAGKTTIVRHLLSKYDFLDFSISATTRAMREKETDGKDYYFISVTDFKIAVENEKFVEWQEVYVNQFYGTLKSEIDRIWENGKTIVFDMDVYGALNIKKAYGEKCLTIFVRPPSEEILIERLKNRKTESEAALQKRVERVKKEMTFEDKFDAVIVNDLLEVALKEAEYFVENFILGHPFEDFVEED